jgi:hypothetical protein
VVATVEVTTGCGRRARRKVYRGVSRWDEPKGKYVTSGNLDTLGKRNAESF